MAKGFAQLSEEQKAALATPWGFARHVLKIPLYPKQEAVLRSVAKHDSKVVFRCGNEVGKTSVVIVVLVLWHLTVFPMRRGSVGPRGGIISTAGAWRQVTGQLMPALKRFEHLFPRLKFNANTITEDGVPRYEGFSTTNQARSQGYHGEAEDPLLAIIDESAAVPDAVFHSIEDRCGPQRLLITGSPLDPVGMFYDNCTKYAAHYTQHSLTQPECAHIGTEKIWRIIEKYDPAALEGEDMAKHDWERIRQKCENPVVLSRVFAEFATAVEGGVLSLRDWEAALESRPEPEDGERHVFCDFAAGGDENVLAVRHGNRVWIEKAWRDRNTMAAVGEFMRLFKKLERQIGLKAHECEGDADGLGKVMNDAIREQGWDILDFHGDSEPLFDPDYFNRVSELWVEGAKRLRKKDVRLVASGLNDEPPRDEELRTQLVTRKVIRHSSGKVWIEPKKQLMGKGRNLPSPDRADALLGAMAPRPQMESVNLVERDRLEDDGWRARRQEEIDLKDLEGAYTG